jgi:hypothetical protein
VTPSDAHEPSREDLERELAGVEERIERVAGRLAFGYGEEGDRDYWRRWLGELRARQAELRSALERSHEAG